MLSHLLDLDETDRRSRFGIAVSDDFVRAYTDAVDFRSDAVFGVFDAELALLGVAHLAIDEGDAEIGISVLPSARGHGLGTALLDRARLHARNRRIRKLRMHCLRENAPMMRLARRQDMHAITESGETDAWVRLQRPNASSFAAEFLAEQLGLYDLGLKTQALSLCRWLASWTARGMAMRQPDTGKAPALTEITS